VASFQSKTIRRSGSSRESRHIRMGEWTLTYTLVRSARRRQRMSLCVAPSGVVELRVPHGASQVDVDAMLYRYQAWIEARLAEAASRPELRPPSFESGCDIPYLGETLRLDVAPGRRRRCLLHGDSLLVQMADPAPAKVSAAVNHWYRERAETVFKDRLMHWSRQIEWVSTPPPLRLRRMRARWGSCSSKGELCLNTHLIKAATACIDAVIVHELCHLQEFQHSRRFYDLMDQVMPDWRCYSEALDQDAPRLLLS